MQASTEGQERRAGSLFDAKPACDFCPNPMRDNGRKISDELENPFSVLVLKMVDPMVSRMHEAGFSPNMVTTLSLVFGLLAILAVRARHPGVAAAMYLFSYYFDCLDGPIARRYDQVTHFGDLYDHGKDIIIVVWLLIEIQRQYPITWSVWLLFLLVILGAMVHMGFVESFNSICCGVANENNFLRICTRISEKFYSASDCETLRKRMRITRWFSDGSFVFLIIAYLIYVSIVE
jgi:hypothetical protein